MRRRRRDPATVRLSNARTAAPLHDGASVRPRYRSLPTFSSFATSSRCRRYARPGSAFSSFARSSSSRALASALSSAACLSISSSSSGFQSGAASNAASNCSRVPPASAQSIMSSLALASARARTRIRLAIPDSDEPTTLTCSHPTPSLSGRRTTSAPRKNSLCSGFHFFAPPAQHVAATFHDHSRSAFPSPSTIKNWLTGGDRL